MRKSFIFLFIFVISLLTVTICFADRNNYHHFTLYSVYFQGDYYDSEEANMSGEIDVVENFMYVIFDFDTQNEKSEPTIFMGNIKLSDGKLYLVNEPFEVNIPMEWSFPYEEIILYFEDIAYIFIEDSNNIDAIKRISDVDISAYTFEELLFLRDQVSDAMIINDVYQKVLVPIGVYQVGVDIPAGHWTVKTLDDPNIEKMEISWGEKLSDTKEYISWSGKYSVYNTVYNQNYKYYNSGNTQTQYSFTVYKGDYVVVKYSPAVFMPYTMQSFIFE